MENAADSRGRIQCQSRDRDWVNRQATWQSMATFEQPLYLTGAINRIKNVTYILASGWSPSPFPQFHEKAKAKGWKTTTIDCGHDVMLDRPEELAEQLLKVTPQRASTAI